MQAAINSKIDFSHIILLSGQDYPIKSNQYIHDFLARNKEREFIAFYPIPNNFWTNQGLDRIQSFHFLEFKNAYLIKGLRRISSVFSKIYRRKFPKELHPYGGPAWWCLTQKCVKFLLGYAQTNRSIIRFFKFVKFPDEIFFQTVVCNSIFAPNVQNSSLTYVNWTNSSDLIVLGIDNFDSLKASDKLFARKFDPKFDPNIFDKLDHENQAIRD
ncbi:MAG: glycosyl transferase family protein [Promethearchaeota archaeon CR_4]|nr:MAG: glycosyl transferase family protein [Candidatus Lokiarchaeota archaeon CR_4]